MKFYRMGHAALEVNDMDRSIKFYRDILGLKAEWEGDPDWANFKLGEDDLSLVRKEGSVHPPHLGLRVESIEELKQAHRELTNAKIEVKKIEKHRDGTYSFYFYDPDRNLLEALFDPQL